MAEKTRSYSSIHSSPTPLSLLRPIPTYFPAGSSNSWVQSSPHSPPSSLKPPSSTIGGSASTSSATTTLTKLPSSWETRSLASNFNKQIRSIHCGSVMRGLHEPKQVDVSWEWRPLHTTTKTESLSPSHIPSIAIIKPRDGLLSSRRVIIPASWSSPCRRTDACVSTRLTGANQAPIVAHGVSRSFRAHHVDAALGLESDGMLRSHAWY